MANGNFKDLSRRIASGKALRDRVFIIAKNPKYDWFQRGLAAMIYKCFGKKYFDTQKASKNYSWEPTISWRTTQTNY